MSTWVIVWDAFLKYNKSNIIKAGDVWSHKIRKHLVKQIEQISSLKDMSELLTC